MTPSNNKKKKKKNKKKSAVITIRIDAELDERLNKISDSKQLSKAALIRNYLNLARFFVIDYNSITSLNKNELLLLKRNYLKDLLENMDQIAQIDMGEDLGRFINDLARLQGKLPDIEFKLDMCQAYGFFPKFIDNEGYILFPKQFGTKKFVESFVWRLITMGNKGDFDKDYTEENIEDSRRTRSSYYDDIQPVRRDATHYAFEFARLKEGEKE
ncbi:MAG: CopG family transcriptional regulator [Promethearchaeia archaeon]